MKFLKLLAVLLSVALTLAACVSSPDGPSIIFGGTTEIALSDSEIMVNGKTVGSDESAGVHISNDIVYYESGKDFTYGEGTEADAHTLEEAAAHTVVHITEPGTYSLSGKLSLGQIAVDLGEDAEEDPDAVVTLILNGVDITCEVAPAVIFYNVYECGSTDTETATKDVDTTAAGANVIIADKTVNSVNGSYVARIYKPDSVELSEDGTAVEDAKKLHKYDAAFYSKMSMNINGGEAGTGVLNIDAENEGLDSELHLTINGGNININSGNDGINTNEDGVSVTTVNGGNLKITVNGETGEGDGIDSNGWLVINGGMVITSACADSADAGIDSDMGIHINGGTVIAGGHMLDRIEDGGQTYAVFNFAKNQTGGELLSLKDKDGNTVIEACPENSYSVLIVSTSDLAAGEYTLWSGDKQLAHQGSRTGGGMFGGMRPNGRPDGITPPDGIALPDDITPPEGMPEHPDDFIIPDNFEPADGDRFPENFELPANFELPEDAVFPDGGKRPGGDGAVPPQMSGDRPERPNINDTELQEVSPVFTIVHGANMFGGVMELE